MIFYGQGQIDGGTNEWLVCQTYVNFTGKSFSEALIHASTNPQYDKRLFM